MDKTKEIMAQFEVPKVEPARNKLIEAIREGFESIKGGVEAVRESKPAQVVDKVLEGIDAFLGPSGKAWMANGLVELQQAFTPGVEQIQPGNNPGGWGTITGIEAAHDRGVYGEAPKQTEQAQEQERTR